MLLAYPPESSLLWVKFCSLSFRLVFSPPLLYRTWLWSPAQTASIERVNRMVCLFLSVQLYNLEPQIKKPIRRMNRKLRKKHSVDSRRMSLGIARYASKIFCQPFISPEDESWQTERIQIANVLFCLVEISIVIYFVCSYYLLDSRAILVSWYSCVHSALAFFNCHAQDLSLIINSSQRDKMVAVISGIAVLLFLLASVRYVVIGWVHLCTLFHILLYVSGSVTRHYLLTLFPQLFPAVIGSVLFFTAPQLKLSANDENSDESEPLCLVYAPVMGRFVRIIARKILLWKECRD